MILTGDCVEVMADMEPESVDAIVTDPPYGLGFMGKEWDRLGGDGWRAGGFGKPGIGDRPTAWTAHGDTANATCRTCGGRMRGARKCACPEPDWYVKGAAVDKRNAGAEQQAFHQQWATEALRVAKPSAYLLAFGGTRTVHRMTVALEDAGWIIRDMLVWAYASGFPKSKASLKPAWEPIVMARKPGPLRDLAIDACRIPGEPWTAHDATGLASVKFFTDGDAPVIHKEPHNLGRWPANVMLSPTEDGRAIFDGGVEGVVGGGETTSGNPFGATNHGRSGFLAGADPRPLEGYGDSGTYSRFFLIAKSSRSDREPVLGGLPRQDDDRDGSFGLDAARPHTKPDYVYERKPRANVHPTVKPTDLMRHLVRLVTPTGGTVLDPFLGSGTTGLAAEMEGFSWIGIERELEYVAIAEARLNGTQRGLGLETA